jgi:hypothetical protein
MADAADAAVAPPPPEEEAAAAPPAPAPEKEEPPEDPSEVVRHLVGLSKDLEEAARVSQAPACGTCGAWAARLG